MTDEIYNSRNLMSLIDRCISMCNIQIYNSRNLMSLIDLTIMKIKDASDLQ